MRILKEFQYKISKKDNLSDLFQVITELRLKHSSTTATNYFSLQGLPFPPGSPVKRVLKKFPELSHFRCGPVFLGENEGDEVSYSTLSNIPDTQTNWSEIESVDIELLENIANGIPKSFPFNEAKYMFEIDWGFYSEEGVERNQNDPFLRNSIIYQNNSGNNQREIGLSAMVELPIPSGDKVPKIPPSIMESIHNLGSVKKERLLIVPNNHEIDELSRKEELASYYHNQYVSKRKKDLYNEVAFPFELPDSLGFYSDSNKGSRKKEIMKHFKKQGYIHLPKETSFGELVIGKRTQRNNYITLHFDSGKYLQNIRCSVAIHGLMWKINRYLELPCRAGSFSDFYPITNEEMLSKVMTNFAAAANYVEKTYIKDIEDIYGSSPSWMEYF